MRASMETISMNGTIVIGEGERDEAPMLFIGEKVGTKKPGNNFHEVDIAVDPLEGTNLYATGAPGAIAVLASSEKGGCCMHRTVTWRLLHGKDHRGTFLEGAVNLDASVKDNLRAIARRLERDVENLVIIVLDRPRHAPLVQEIREA
jgi:fructose-1,6-bisphosphatase II